MEHSSSQEHGRAWLVCMLHWSTFLTSVGRGCLSCCLKPGGRHGMLHGQCMHQSFLRVPVATVPQMNMRASCMPCTAAVLASHLSKNFGVGKPFWAHIMLSCTPAASRRLRWGQNSALASPINSLCLFWHSFRPT